MVNSSQLHFPGGGGLGTKEETLRDDWLTADFPKRYLGLVLIVDMTGY